MGSEEDILMQITPNKDKFPFEFERKERIKNNISDVTKYYSDSQNQDQIELLKKRFEAVGGELKQYNTIEKLTGIIKSLPETKKNAKFFTYNNEIKEFLLQNNFPFANNITDANITITFCDFVASRTATIMVSAHSVIGRRVISFPDTHIVIASKDQVVFDLSEANKLFI